MDKNTRQILSEKMYEVIREERLPIPKRILIRQPTKGMLSARGKCIKSRLNDEFTITVTVSRPHYVPDAKGRYFDKKDHSKKFSCIGWKENNRETIISDASHEIAHLKFWHHRAEHKSYTNYLIEILTKKLEGWNNEQPSAV